MTGHLGGTTGEVHAQARRVLDFWFALGAERQFGKDAALDAEIAQKFGSLRRHVVDGDAAGWRDDPQAMLAAIILIDQFGRNLFRGRAEAFEADPLALSLTYEAIDRGWHRTLPPHQAVFLLMPLMHAEDAQAQADSVARFAELGIEDNLKYARDHRDVFERFGRFPGRNDALGRGSTEAELDYLSQPGAGW